MAIYSAPNALSSIERHFQFHRRKYDSSGALEEFQFRPSSPPRGCARALNRRNGRHSKFRTRNYLRGHYHPLSPPVTKGCSKKLLPEMHKPRTQRSFPTRNMLLWLPNTRRTQKCHNTDFIAQNCRIEFRNAEVQNSDIFPNTYICC